MFGKDRRGSGCRKLCFALYFIVTWSIVALVLLMIWMAPRWALTVREYAGVNIVSCRRILSGISHHGHSHEEEQHQEEIEAHYYHH